MKYSFEVFSPIPSKKNLLKRGRGGRMYYDKKTKEILDDIVFELMNQKKKYKGKLPLRGELGAEITLQGEDRRDFNNEIATILDCCQEARIVENDRSVKNFTNCHKKKSSFPSCKVTFYVI